jgi:hypothetical protein
LLLFLEKEGLALLSIGQPPGRLVLCARVFWFFFAKKELLLLSK